MFNLIKKPSFILGIGHSHLYPINTGYKENIKFFLEEKKQRIEFISFLDTKYQNRALDFNPIESEFFFHNSIEKFIKKNKDNLKFIFSIFGGNSHNILGLVQLPEKFDFIIPEKPYLKFQDDSTLLPYNLVEELMKTQGGFPETIGCLKFLRKIYKGRIIQLEPPPPIEDNDYLLKFSGPFKEKFEAFGISPPTFRYKLWSVYTKLVADECKKLDIDYMRAPNMMQSDTGYLTTIALGEDPTHANSAYGFEVLKDILSHNQ